MPYIKVVIPNKYDVQTGNIKSPRSIPRSAAPSPGGAHEEELETVELAVELDIRVNFAALERGQ